MAGHTGLVPYEWLWQHRWSGLAGAFALGLIASGFALRDAPAQSASWLKDYFLGRKKNPSLAGGRVDAKMYLYAAGAIVLELNLLSFAAHHVLNHPTDFSLGVILYVCLFTWFICEYLVFEHVHLYTYDLFAERLGFKLVGGCLVFYPYFYGVGLWGDSRFTQPGFADLVPDPLGGCFLFRMGLGARREHAEVLFQARSFTRISRIDQTAKHLGRKATHSVQRLLGFIKTYQLFR